MKANKAFLIAGVAVAACLSGTCGTWEKCGKGPVLGGGELGACRDAAVVTDDGSAPFAMYFSWRTKKAIARVRSDDGVRWSQEPEICLDADPTSGWEDDVFGGCAVRKDGVWHLWYTGTAKGVSKIGYATSKDGVSFARVRREPVLVPDRVCERRSVASPCVRWDAAHKLWRMWYAAGEAADGGVICVAESADGITWTKGERNPVLGPGPRDSWERGGVGACEVQALPDGRWAMFYVGSFDRFTARIGCAISEDGVTNWRRLPQNPILAPDLGTWDARTCGKPSAVRDDANGRWLLWYDGRNGGPDRIGLATHRGLDLEAPSPTLPDTRALLTEYVRRFNAWDLEFFENEVPNSAAEEFLQANAPRFACPDKDVERTYYFRWWTYRKHLVKTTDGWAVSEWLRRSPRVRNTVVCAAGHHIREGRWLRDPQYVSGLVRFWLADPSSEKGRWNYSSWPYTGTRLFAEVSGLDNLPVELLDAAVAYYRRWEEGFVRTTEKLPMGGDGKGGFLSIDNNEGSEHSLGGHGYKPLFSSAMWSEANAIAEVARAAGRTELADEFAAKAKTNLESILANCWNEDVGFFTTARTNGVKGTVRELHGYAPWYFGLPTGKTADWSQLADTNGFAAAYGLSFPERRAPGFTFDYSGHECKWNGPSWPFATSVALTAYANDLHASPSPSPHSFTCLLWQYAAVHRRERDPDLDGDSTVVPWIDENLHPDKPEWIARKIIVDTPLKLKFYTGNRGKDYNHSTFCDLVISGLVGFVPQGSKGFAVDPLFPETWDYLVLENLRYRGHDVDIRWQRGKGLSVSVDGKIVASRKTLGPIRFDWPK